MKLAISSVSLLVLGLLTACGGDDPPATADANPNNPDAPADPTCPKPVAERLFPLAVGNKWSYKITEPGKPDKVKDATVEAFEDIPGKPGVKGFRLRSEKLSGATVSWQQDTCDTVIRFREHSFDAANVFLTDQTFVPSKLRVDETAAHTAAGAAWLVSYSEVELNKITGATKSVSKDENWSVVSVAESVTVPSGTYTALHLKKVTSGAADKDFWFVKGIGKVKETGGQTEELVSFTVKPGV
jgi:hypothetical protein